MPSFEYENIALNNGFKYVCGVDEAGRGPLAGPVYAAAVILPANIEIAGLDDSKKLSEKKREELYDVIIEKAQDYCIAYATVEEIEKLNILNATMLAMQRAVDGLKMCDMALIDGNRMPNLDIAAQTLVKGDQKSCSISAASILAKVTRDRLLVQMDAEFPQYNFKKHKGYGTKEHIENIKKYGSCKYHRPSFLKNI
ncbi:MAG: ribonuclease HII [Oscillospiraceae bacterium]|nr:ribonuclease HII [Candidatus Equicaccousia limihippi]